MKLAQQNAARRGYHYQDAVLAIKLIAEKLVTEEKYKNITAAYGEMSKPLHLTNVTFFN